MKKFNNIFEFVIFVAFGWTLLTIGSSLIAFFALLVEYTKHTVTNHISEFNFFLILKSENDSNSTKLISPLLLASWSFGPVYIYCEFGTAVTTEFAKFDDELYQCKWYSYSIEIQKMMLIFIAETQDPVFIRGFCNIVCIRDSFKKACSSLSN